MKRQCGDCTLCCKLLPVRELGKLAGQRCEHQRRTGCRVYYQAGMPASCKMWSCQWLTNPSPETAALSRPDRSHCVVDIMPDFVTIRDESSGSERKVYCVQIWVDTGHRDAWRDPAMMRFIEARAREGVCALIRYSQSETLAVFAPPLNAAGDWHVADNTQTIGRAHTAEEILSGAEVKIEIEISP